MKNKISYVLAVMGLFLFLSGCNSTLTPPASQGPASCESICEQVVAACTDAIDQDTCMTSCESRSDAEKTDLDLSGSCGEIFDRYFFIKKMTISEVTMPQDMPLNSDCDAACSNYVRSCLTLVPNANQALFDAGFESCSQECKQRDEDKVTCMIHSIKCEDFTDICGL